MLGLICLVAQLMARAVGRNPNKKQNQSKITATLKKPAAAAAAAATKKKKTKNKLHVAACCQNDEVVQHQQPLSFLLLLSLLFQLVAPFGSPHRYSDHYNNYLAVPHTS
jgi:hypothetical protein